MPPKAATTGDAQDPAISDVKRGVSTSTTAGKTEDQKRAEGTDASADAGDHDFSPEANASVGTVGSGDTYGGGARGEHPNMIPGQTQTLVVGQAPVACVVPQIGSRNYGEKFHPSIPNAKHQSPVVRGVAKDDRNDPKHPEHSAAERTHPDYGKTISEHVGQRTEAPDFVDLKNEELAKTDGAVADIIT